MNIDLKEVITEIISREYPQAQIKDMHYISLSLAGDELDVPNNDTFYFGFLSCISSTFTTDTTVELGVQYVQFKNSVATNVSSAIQSTTQGQNNAQIIFPNQLCMFNYLDLTTINSGVVNFLGLVVQLSDITFI